MKQMCTTRSPSERKQYGPAILFLKCCILKLGLAFEEKIYESEQGSRHESGDQGHHHQNCEYNRREDAKLASDGQHDKLHQATRIHERP